MRKKLIVTVTFLGGIYFFLEFVFKETWPWTASVSQALKARLGWRLFTDKGIAFGAYHEEISTAAILVGVMALGLGLVNVTRIHGARLLKLRKGWVNSAALLAGVVVTLILGFWEWASPEALPAKIYGNVIMGTKGLFAALSSSMFSLLAFYVATAAYRSFRVKSGEAALLMLAALLVMMGQIPIGVMVFDAAFRFAHVNVSITEVRAWILMKLNVGAFRAISLGFGVAGLSMAMRMWLSMETSSFFKEEE